MASRSTQGHAVPPSSSFSVLFLSIWALDAHGNTAGVMLHLVSAVAMLAADRAFNVFGDHSYRMDLRG
jgi:hypothetical protein